MPTNACLYCTVYVMLESRLAAIDGDDVYTVLCRNTVTSLAYRGTVSHRHLD